MSDKPTLEDVARHSGVSTATVSRCLNSPDKVVKATRTRVMAAVQELGYTPNFGARVMAAKRTNTIGAVIPTIENAIFARGLQAFQEELYQRGFHLLVASSSYDAAREDEQIRSLISRGAEGLLLIGRDRSSATERFLKQRGLPVVAAWIYEEDTAFPTIGFDNRSSMRSLADMVLSKGHTRLAYVSAPVSGNDRARGRLDGVRDAMAARNLDPRSLSLIETPYGLESGAAAFDQLMQESPRPTVIMCGNDVLAVGAIMRAKSTGYSVPEDVSITGFDDIDIATIIEPALTTVHVPHRMMGKTAAQVLTAMVSDRVDRASIHLHAHIKTRASLAGPCLNS